MGTAVFLHAHPDDESIVTGGTMAKLAASGHRVVLVLATGGEYGEVPPDLAPGESLADRRRAETACSASVLGVASVEWLGYGDSGMTGWAQNDDARSFLRADVDEAAERLAVILRGEHAGALVCYDWHGNYGHPDHIQVHRVGHRAAVLAGTPVLYEATVNRDEVIRSLDEAREKEAFGEDPGLLADFDVNDTDDGTPFGLPEAELTTAVDVTAFTRVKRASMACHASQITDTSFFLRMPEEMFTRAFGTEWFRRHGVAAGVREHELALG